MYRAWKSFALQENTNKEEMTGVHYFFWIDEFFGISKTLKNSWVS
jgi:hypothetical protein